MAPDARTEAPDGSDAKQIAAASESASSIGPFDILLMFAEGWRTMIVVPVVITVVAIAATYVMAPTFTARTTILPPQQAQSAAATALASLGALGNLAGSSLRTPTDQYAALLQSTVIQDRLIDEFKLMEVYRSKLRVDARKKLQESVRVSIGKRDGLITIEADDSTPKRAADLANQHVVELRRLASQLALTEAQQRRAFFEAQLSSTQKRLTEAQRTLSSSGFTAGSLRVEPRAAAESYARLKAEVTAAEVRLQTMRQSLADTASEIQQQLSTLRALRDQLAQIERSARSEAGPDTQYIDRYREFKYQETLFELLARQYELARLDESREGTLIQVVDEAQPPERRSKPRRAVTAMLSMAGGLLLAATLVLLRLQWRRSTTAPDNAAKLAQLRSALGRR